MRKEKLIPPDLERCQVEWSTGSFMTLGRPEDAPMIRCTVAPKWVATEKVAPKGKRRGSMSICETHREVLEQKKPDFATFEEIVLEPRVKKAKRMS